MLNQPIGLLNQHTGRQLVRCAVGQPLEAGIQISIQIIPSRCIQTLQNDWSCPGVFLKPAICRNGHTSARTPNGWIGGGVTNCKLVTCKLTKWWENLCVDALLIPNSRSLTTMQFHYGESYLRAIWSQALWKINPHKVQVRYNFRGCKWKDFFVPQINRLTGLWS